MNELPLKDIHLPEGVLWWPPAPGWWVLGILLILFLLLLPRLWRWLRYKPVKSLSLKEFYLIRKNYQLQKDRKQTLQAITALLRRTVISKCGRIGHAGVVGDEWINQLNQISNKDCFTQVQCELLKHGRYQPVIQSQNKADIDSLLHSCENWIKSLPKGGSHAAT
ncbi:MAG: hypothetical protein ACJA0I_000435 [Gammaproteobacteria bacterium]|jgi:hypothetical protein